MVLGLRVYYVWENARRDRAAALEGGRESEGGGDGVADALAESGDFADITDRENRQFRYAL
jgi:hypothetical protein